MPRQPNGAAPHRQPRSPRETRQSHLACSLPPPSGGRAFKCDYPDRQRRLRLCTWAALPPVATIEGQQPREEETPLVPHRILTPNTHSEETLEIAHDLIPPGYELVTAPHGRPEFWELLRNSEFYIGAGQFKHGPEFYSHAPQL